jgi:hypothetical protein
MARSSPTTALSREDLPVFLFFWGVGGGRAGTASERRLSLARRTSETSKKSTAAKEKEQQQQQREKGDVHTDTRPTQLTNKKRGAEKTRRAPRPAAEQKKNQT